MASLAVPLIEGVVARVLAALGVGVVAGAAGEAAKEQARKRQEEADKAKSTPISRTEAQTKARKKCPDCTPDRGAPFNRPTAGWSEVSIAYQARIGGMPVGPGFITEWLFSGVTFDGFDSSECLLKEAKAKYDQFFDDFGDPKEWWKGDEPIMAEASAQSVVAKPQPPVQLRWHFMQPMSYRFFSKVFSAMRLPIETVFQP
ncbi:restriction endonuclease fold toxin 5 domain-containing protein [Pseudomonas aeruginosa]|uniref:restriction endonuclease fold toxin 5 domain-containing protein n=1 Tax=Pseudomonas aeruginosa TaxID=287 RepID=UPI002148DB7F|nr:restriction endonuclease fold toxin 5 domain-containing protein [Pseudomonas aeruginosa]MCQ9730185.1 restriction endonuclease fold toxin 5 domain-containing protein [Pseudomonas aeruginosa]